MATGAHTRSGHAAQVQNRRVFISRAQLLERHHRLLQPHPVTTVNYYHLRNDSIVQAVVRMPFNYAGGARRYLREQCLELMAREAQPATRLEVSITFNAILHDLTADTWSVFYGLNFQEGRGRVAGIAELLYHGEPYTVRNVLDVGELPIRFDPDELYERYQRGYEHSQVRIDTFLNVVYLIQSVNYGGANNATTTSTAGVSNGRRPSGGEGDVHDQETPANGGQVYGAKRRRRPKAAGSQRR
jgi:hypothetical protein